MVDVAQIPVLETARLLLRGIAERDQGPLATIFGDARVMRFLGGETRTPAAAWGSIAWTLGHWALRGYGFYAVEEKATRRFIGRIGLLNPAGWPGIEIAWHLASERWGLGFASEGAAVVRDHAFATLRLPRLVSIIHPDNAASIRVALKLGEHFERMIDFEGKPVRLYAIDNPRG